MIQVNKNIGIIGVSFTPDYYKRAYRNYQMGILREVFALIERAVIDGFIAGCLTARNAGYKRKWQIIPASEDPKDVDMAQWVADIFNNLKTRILFQDIIDARLKQYSVIPLEWAVQDGYQIVTNFEKLDQKYFRFDPKDRQLKIDMGSTLVPIPPDSALIIRYRDPMILLTILKSYIRKEFGEESWSSFLEIFGEPYIWAEYPIGLSEPEKKNLENGVLSVGASARGIVPAGTKINITESSRSTSDHKDYKEDIKTEISLALLGHEKAAGGTRSGMQVGQNQDVFRVTQHIAIDDMDFIEEETQQFIKMLVNRNFKDIKRFPQLAFDKSDAADPKDKLTAAQLALNAGGQIDASFWEDFGVPLTDKTKPLSATPLFPGDRVN